MLNLTTSSAAILASVKHEVRYTDVKATVTSGRAPALIEDGLRAGFRDALTGLLPGH
jgi:hypothetical protein